MNLKRRDPICQISKRSLKLKQPPDFGSKIAVFDESMRLSSRNYREYLQEWRSHPAARSRLQNSSVKSGLVFVFVKDLKPVLYATIPAFSGLEVFIQFKTESLPLGISFPFGFILFWALIYSYRNPLKTVPEEKSPPRRKEPQKVSSRTQMHQNRVEQIRETPLPKEIESALLTLGLKNCRDWGTIHKRYRELAKQVHPDLNPDLTAAENRFIVYDHAYRKLVAVKKRYFKTAV